jgi:hypothetical protein
MRLFRIYGDNIVECERALGLIVEALGALKPDLTNTHFSIVIPTIEIIKNGERYSFSLIPGYGDHRWTVDILKLLDSKGGLLREAPDSLLTEIVDGSEDAILAIEFCGALPAGNQAWQRNGRALSFAHSKIPYFYITEIGGFELDGERDRKAERVPNPLIPFSYVSTSIEMGTAVLPIYIPSPGASLDTQKKYENIFGLEDLKKYIYKAIQKQDTEEITAELTRKTIQLVALLADSRSKDDSISASDWLDLYSIAISKKTKLNHAIEKSYSKDWKKKTSLSTLTETVKLLLELAKKHTYGVTSNNLPISLLKENQRDFFSTLLKKLYPNGGEDFFEFIRRKNGPLAFAWIAGFKPKGDDARPDRGLSPLLRMVVGSDCDVVAVVYGPAPKPAVDLLKRNQTELGQKNGLWESIIKTADAVIVDCKFDGIDSSSLVLTERKNLRRKAEHVYAKELSIKKYGEQDVDTAIHYLFTKLLSAEVFEGLCNPPGGDWSGISLKNAFNGTEFRWLTLPRVTESDQKRPDHIFQIFTNTQNYIVICESKDSIKQIETGIGPRLIKYLTQLAQSIPDVERSYEDKKWKHSSQIFNIANFEFVSVAAGIVSSTSSLVEIASRGQSDLVLGFDFKSNECVQIISKSVTKKGNVIEQLLLSLPTSKAYQISN